ncbi:DUF262 domain-containing protein [Iodobacter arcticus]
MSYHSDTIALTIGRMNQQYFLPTIQREFVWEPEQIMKLFDSIMRKYPISSFLFWEIRDQNREKWQAYKFLDKAKQGGTHNELAITDGVNNLSMILDGQQRLTSLMIGLKGTYVTRKKGGRIANPDAWTTNKLHLDLLAAPSLDGEEDKDGLYYKFAFKDATPQPNSENFWFRVAQIMDFDERQKFDVFLRTKR